jgi:hypothetical protein
MLGVNVLYSSEEEKTHAWVTLCNKFIGNFEDRSTAEKNYLGKFIFLK